MKIITPKGEFDTVKDAIVLIFKDDDELSSFISMIIKTPVKSSGVRVLPLIPKISQSTPIQLAILNIIKGLDGVGGKEHENIIDNSLTNINDILKF